MVFSRKPPDCPALDWEFVLGLPWHPDVLSWSLSSPLGLLFVPWASLQALRCRNCAHFVYVHGVFRTSRLTGEERKRKGRGSQGQEGWCPLFIFPRLETSLPLMLFSKEAQCRPGWQFGWD